jgi:catalase
MASALVADLLDVLDKLAGGVHPGFRPVHARGVMYSGTFIPGHGAAAPPRRADLNDLSEATRVGG